MSPHWRFLIVGAGPAGSSAAIKLRSAGHSVVLLEKSRFEEQRVGELLSPEGQVSVKRLLPRGCDEFFVSSVGIVGAWESDQLQRFSEASWCTLDRRALDEALAQEAARLGADLQLGSSLHSLEKTDLGWNYATDQTTGHADWLIVANGRNSPLARTLGGQVQKFDRQIALVGFLEGRYNSTSDMLIETTSNGWWYASPIDSTRAVATFITDSDQDRGDPHQAWLNYLSESRFAKQRFGSMTLSQKPLRVAAGCSFLTPFYGDRWAAIGESAVSFDPLSSMGVGRACDMGTWLGEIFLDAAQRDHQIDLLSYYERIGTEFYIHRQNLLKQYLAVKRFADSSFWSRRTAGHQNFRISTRHKPAKLIYSSDSQACSPNCQNCARLNALGVKPEGGLRFPFLLTETPEGFHLGVSFHCGAMRESKGTPLRDFEPEILDLLSQRPPAVLPKRLMMTWGKALDWNKYPPLEEHLLQPGSISNNIRSLGWAIVCWLHHPNSSEPVLQSQVPADGLIGIEQRITLQLLAELEGADHDAVGHLFQALLNDCWVSLPDWNFQGHLSQLVESYEVEEKPWIKQQSERFLKALIERKFLLGATPIFYNLMLLSALPRLLVIYAALQAWRRESKLLETEDLYEAFSQIELRVSRYDATPLIASKRVSFDWYLNFYHWQKSRDDHESAALSPSDVNHCA